MTRLVAIVCYYLGVDAFFYWLNRHAKRIITFHNVLPDDIYTDDVANGVSCSESEFRYIVRELKKRWRFSTDLFDCNTITITFDDGYLNQYEIGAKILREEGEIPAYLFVAGDVLAGKELLVDQLLHWAARVPKEILAQMGFATGLELWVKKLWPEFVADSASQGRTLYEHLDKMYSFEKIYDGMDLEYKRLRLGGISEGRLADLRSRGWKIGWHTKTHYPLSVLTKDLKLAELTAPVDFRTEAFSYPYGENQSVDVEAKGIVRKLCYPCAVSNTMSPAGGPNRFFLPRITLLPDRYLLHFELSGGKYFLKFGRLLPRCTDC